MIHFNNIWPVQGRKKIFSLPEKRREPPGRQRGLGLTGPATHQRTSSSPAYSTDKYNLKGQYHKMLNIYTVSHACDVSAVGAFLLRSDAIVNDIPKQSCIKASVIHSIVCLFYLHSFEGHSPYGTILHC